MTEQDFAGFLLALGQEFCWALVPPVDRELITPQEGYEVWLRVFGNDPSPAALAALSEQDFHLLTNECRRCFECPDVSLPQIRTAVARVLARWPT